MTSEAVIKPDWKPPPRLLQFGINAISIQEIDVANHTFTANILCSYVWKPLLDREPTWRPWVQFHNIKALTEIDNPRIVKLSEDDLKKLANSGKNAEERRNFVGTFMVPLELHDFPFDYQKLVIVVVFDSDSDVLVTHRGPVTVKCNNEADVVSEWNVIRAKAEETAEIRFSCDQQEYGHSSSHWATILSLFYTAKTNLANSFWADSRPRENLWEFSGLKSDNHGLTVYRFDTQRTQQSGLGQSYQRLEFFTVVSRKSSGTIWAVLVPNVLLSFSSMSCYALVSFDRFLILIKFTHNSTNLCKI